MAKVGSFHRVNFTMYSLGCGQYKIETTYYGKHLTIHSNNSLAYDDLDSDNIKKQKDACASIYYEICSYKERIIGDQYANRRK